MKLTSKARYAVMAVADLALYTLIADEAIVLREIADRQDISISYLEQLFAKLRKKGIVNSMRGPGGGYFLARDADKITVWDVITAVDETIELKRCSGNGNCTHGEKCLTHNLWNDLTDTISLYLKQTTIASIIRQHLEAEPIPENLLKRLEQARMEQRILEHAQQQGYDMHPQHGGQVRGYDPHLAHRDHIPIVNK